MSQFIQKLLQHVFLFFFLLLVLLVLLLLPGIIRAAQCRQPFIYFVQHDNSYERQQGPVCVHKPLKSTKSLGPSAMCSPSSLFPLVLTQIRLQKQYVRAYSPIKVLAFWDHSGSSFPPAPCTPEQMNSRVYFGPLLVLPDFMSFLL